MFKSGCPAGLDSSEGVSLWLVDGCLLSLFSHDPLHFSSCKDGHSGWQLTLMCSFDLNYLCKDSVSNYSHILRCTADLDFNIWILWGHNLIHSRSEDTKHKSVEASSLSYVPFPSSSPLTPFCLTLYITQYRKNSQCSRNNFQNDRKQIRMDGKHLIVSAAPEATIFQEPPSSMASEFPPTTLRMTYGSRTIFRFDKWGLAAAHRLWVPLFSLPCDKAVGNLLHHISAQWNCLTVGPVGPVGKSRLHKLETAVMVSFLKN